MKIWITAANIKLEDWKRWIDEIHEWLSYVNLKTYNEYNINNILIGIFEFDYFTKHNKHNTKVKKYSGFHVLDGWIFSNSKQNKICNLEQPYDHDYNAEKLFNRNKYKGEFSYIEVLNERITLVTDFYATKPIYYYNKNSSFIATNDLRLLILNNDIHWSIDQEKCAFFISSFGAVSDNEPSNCETFFNNIKKIPPHTKLIIEKSSEIIKHESYINIQNDLLSDFSNNLDYVSLFKSSFEKTVFNRIQGRSVVLTLSGGIDSSIILAASKNLDLLDNVSALNMSFKNINLCASQDEEIARKLIKDFGIKGGIIYGDNLLSIPNPLVNGDSLDYLDGPNPSANKLAQEVFAYYALNLKADAILTGEQGDAILGEDSIVTIYDSLFMSGKYKDINNLLKFLLSKGKLFYIKKIFTYFIFNLLPYLRNKFYRTTYWEHTKSTLPNYFTDYLKNFELLNSAHQRFESCNYQFKLLGHMYTFDYFFPKAGYINFISRLITHSHPFIDEDLLKFILSSPTHIHCNYKEYKPGENYLRSKYLARKAYESILPDYARLKHNKTSYAGMSRQMMLNSKEEIINFIFDKEELHIEKMGLVDEKKFKRHLGAALIRMEDPNNTLGLDYQYIRTAIQLEIWLSCIYSNKLKELTMPRPPRQLASIEWIN